MEKHLCFEKVASYRFPFGPLSGQTFVTATPAYLQKIKEDNVACPSFIGSLDEMRKFTGNPEAKEAYPLSHNAVSEFLKLVDAGEAKVPA